MKQNEMFDQIRKWAKDRGIYNSGDPKTQMLKLVEEQGELARAILKKDFHGTEDSIGDMAVVLVNLAVLCNTSIEDCIQQAWNEIKHRKGKMIDGTFVKEEDLQPWQVDPEWTPEFNPGGGAYNIEDEK